MSSARIMYDPLRYVRDLQQILISDKKKIAFLFGAGTSVPHIDTIRGLTEGIHKEIIKSKDNYRNAISKVESAIGKEKYNVETLLSNLELKKLVIGNETINGLNHEQLSCLIQSIKSIVRAKASVHDEADADKLSHTDFAEWIGRASRKQSVEIFTTNYDLLFELGLETKNIPYYDGFTGSYKPFFNSESIEDIGFMPRQTKLWKIHGSIGWFYDAKYKKVIRGAGEDMLIYPSTLKYNESKKMPYTALLDRLTNFLRQPDSVLISCGYSFGDEHINERILSSLSNSEAGHVIALLYDKIDENKNSFTESPNLAAMAKSNRKLSVYACNRAIIGGQLGEWAIQREYNNDDIGSIIKICIDESRNKSLNNHEANKEDTLSKVELLLPRFDIFVSFLKKMILEDELVTQQ